MPRRLKICFLAPGTNVHTLRWVRSIAERGHETLLVSHPCPANLQLPTYDPYERMGLLARMPKVRALVAEAMIRRRLTAFAPDLTHLHYLTPHVSTLRLVRRFSPAVISVWGSDLIYDSPILEPRRRRALKTHLLRSARALTATSRFLAEQVQRFLGSNAAEVRVIPFGVDCERFCPVPEPEPRPVLVIGYLKHYLPKYGPDVLLRAAALLVGSGLRFRLEMYGTHDPSPYRRLVRELGLEAVSHVEGAVPHDQVPGILRRFDVFAMPSRYEAFGVAALEASACALPVVASRVGGVPEVVLDGATGLLVPPSDPEALAAALARLLRDPALSRKLGDAGRRLALASYRWEECVTRMEELYFEVTAPGVPRRD